MVKFVTFEIAKKLDEVGFEWDTSEMFERNILVGRYDDYRKPTISQVLKWFREENKLHITLLYITDSSMDADLNICDERCYFGFSVISLNDGSTLYDSYEESSVIEYKTYELAALAGIEYVLNNLI